MQSESRKMDYHAGFHSRNSTEFLVNRFVFLSSRVIEMESSFWDAKISGRTICLHLQQLRDATVEVRYNCTFEPFTNPTHLIHHL